MDRKAFINSFVRVSILSSFLLLTGFLLSRRKITGGNSCPESTFCSNCSKLSGCPKEEAIKYRSDG